MRKRFRDWFGWSKGNVTWEFKQAELTKTAEPLCNPARGWYTIYTFMAEKEPDFNEILWCSESKDTLALVIINIGAYREKRLDEAAMERIRSILMFFKERSFDIILRVTYDHEGKAVEREPFFFKQVKEHLEQLVPVVREFDDTVFIWQGMLIGNWGEMHTSRFVSPDKLREMWRILYEGLKDRIFLAVRRPSMWRILHTEACGKPSLKEYVSTGLFDDAIFGSESHLGTFGKESKLNTGWDGLWSRQEELDFESNLCLMVPNGGEAVCGESYAKEFTPQTTVEVLRKMHVTYLNQAYDENILKLWKEWTWEEAGVKQSFYDYVGQHLGYRFVIRSVAAAAVALEDTKDVVIRLTVTIENVGFANCYQDVMLLLECRELDGTYDSKCIDCDVRTWDSNTTQTVSVIVKAKESDLYLSAKRKSDGRSIYFANKSDNAGRVFLGYIMNI